MALSADAARLTRAHQRAQARLGADTVALIRRVWPALDLGDLDGTIDRWLALASPVVRAQRTTSARLAANYLTVVRAIELGDIKPIVPTLAETVDQERLATSLRVTGPVSLKANVGRGMLLSEAARIAEERSADAGARHALDGGRETIAETTGADQRAQGWVWTVTSGKPCDYCAGLDGVTFYQGEEVFQAHDGCGCQPLPAF